MPLRAVQTIRAAMKRLARCLQFTVRGNDPEAAMELRTQLAQIAFALVLVMSALACLTPEPACPFAGASKMRRVLMLDAAQKHPIWVDARHEGMLVAAGLLDAVAPDAPPPSYVM